MSLARIFAHSVEDADSISGQLRARGYNVEVVFPDALPDRPADLELRVERCTAEQAVARVEASSGTSDKCVFIAPCIPSGATSLARSSNRELLVLELSLASSRTNRHTSLEALSSLAIEEVEPAQKLEEPLEAIKAEKPEEEPVSEEHPESQTEVVTTAANPNATRAPENWASDLFPIQPCAESDSVVFDRIAKIAETARTKALVSRFLIAAAVLLAICIASIRWIELRRASAATAVEQRVAPAAATQAKPEPIKTPEQSSARKTAAVPKHPAVAAPVVLAAKRHALPVTKKRGRRASEDDLVAADTVTYFTGHNTRKTANDKHTSASTAKAMTDLNVAK